MFAQIYLCSKCGETWRVSSHQIIDTENDRVETFLHCDVCSNTVWEEKKENGLPCMHALTDFEIEEAMQNDFDCDTEIETW